MLDKSGMVGSRDLYGDGEEYPEVPEGEDGSEYPDIVDGVELNEVGDQVSAPKDFEEVHV